MKISQCSWQEILFPAANGCGSTVWEKTKGMEDAGRSLREPLGTRVGWAGDWCYLGKRLWIYGWETCGCVYSVPQDGKSEKLWNKYNLDHQPLSLQSLRWEGIQWRNIQNNYTESLFLLWLFRGLKAKVCCVLWAASAQATAMGSPNSPSSADIKAYRILFSLSPTLCPWLDLQPALELKGWVVVFLSILLQYAHTCSFLRILLRCYLLHEPVTLTSLKGQKRFLGPLCFPFMSNTHRDRHTNLNT